MLVVPSILDAVTVHAEGALCTRLATVQVEDGRIPTQVRINGLPLSLRSGSLRASILRGPPGLAVRDIRPTFDVQLPPEVDIPAEKLALEEAQSRLADLTSRLEAVQRELAHVGKLKPEFPARNKEEREPRDAPLDALLTLSSFIDSELAALHEKRLDLERQRRDAEAQVQYRRRRLQESSSAVRVERARVYRAAVLTLAGPLPSEEAAQLALEYAVPGARWVPTYDLRLPRNLEEGTLRMRASVLQRTGEDWTGVRLSVSTADLDRRAEVPELKALRIGRRQPPPARSGWREPPPGLDELFTGYDAVRPPPGVGPAPLPEPPPPALQAPKPPSGMKERLLESAPELPRKSAPAGKTQGAPRAPMDSDEEVTGSFDMPEMDGAPSMAAPPPPPQRSRGLGAFGGGVPRASAPGRGGGPPPPPAAMPMRRPSPEKLMEEEEPMAEEEAALEGGGGAAPGTAPARLEPADALLDYGRLELAPASDSSARGRLRPRPPHVTRELLALAALHVRVDVTAILAVSEQEVSTVWQAPLPAWSVPPRQSSPHFDSRFDVETRADVPSDGAWHTVPVLSVPVGLAAEYVCVPSVEPRAFRTVRVENRTPYPLLAGPVDVTLGDEFLMTSPLPTLAPGATQRLGLGVEESIKVARNTRFDEATGGIFGGATMLTHHVSVELANRLANRVFVEVCERVPVVPTGSEKDIKVEETEVAPVWQKRTPLPGEAPVEGERAWRVVLNPGEAQTLKATWTVRIPASKMLGGGNRRT